MDKFAKTQDNYLNEYSGRGEDAQLNRFRICYKSKKDDLIAPPCPAKKASQKQGLGLYLMPLYAPPKPKLTAEEKEEKYRSIELLSKSQHFLYLNFTKNP